MIGHTKNSGANTYSVNLGYADTLRPNPVNFPTPWDGSPNVVFEGCGTPCAGGLDGGAVEIINTSTAAEMFDSVVISFTSACVYDIWPHNVSLPKGDELIITENAGGGPGGCTVSTGQMDSSDIGPSGGNWAGNCSQSGIIPSIAVTEHNTQTVFNDATQVLNTGGVDANSCGHPNESEQWTPIGSAVCYGATLTATPASQSVLPGATASVTAKLLNSCGNPLKGATVDLNVTRGPNAGTAVSGTTGSNGSIKLTYSGDTQGIDTVSVTVPNTAGTITAPPVSVVWETAALALTPTSGLPGSTVTFKGSGYTAGETVLVDENSVGGTQLASVTASATGKISGSFTVPAPTGSGAMIAAVAVGQTSSKQGWAAFSSGCTDEWTNTSGGNWTTASDWSTGSVPGSSDVACVISPGTYSVVMNNSETVSGLIVGTSATTSPGAQTLDLQAAGPGSVSLSFGSATVGKHGVFSLDSIDADAYSLISGGTLTNSGTFHTVAGSGGTRYIRANIVNTATGTVVMGAASSLFDEAFSFTNSGAFTVLPGSGFGTNGGATFSQSGGTLANKGSMLIDDTTFDQSGGTDSGNAITFVSSDVNDSAGAGTFLFQCTNDLSGTVPGGQSIDVQANGCGNASIQLVGNVVNKGTLTLDSTDGDSSSYLSDTVSGDVLTNNGTLQTVAGAGGTRFLRMDVMNAAGGTVLVGATDSRFDQTYTFTNNGSFTVSPGGGFSTNGSATFTQSGGTLANNGSMDVISTTFNQTGGNDSGHAVIMQNTTLNDAVGSGSFILQCGNSLSGTIPAGQTVNVQGNACGSAGLTVLANVTNAGTLSLDSASADDYSLIQDSVGGDTLTNDGTIQTVQDAGNIRYIRLNVVNDSDGTVLIGAADSRFDQGYTFTNNGSFTVSSGGGFSTNGSATFTQSGGTLANNGSMFVLSTTFNQTGGNDSGNAIIVQNTPMTDSAGTGSFVLQCGNSLSGKIPVGQSIDIQANACGSSSTTLLGNVTNNGTLSLDSVDADTYSLITDSVSGDSLTNNGTFQTLAGAGGTRYLRVNVVNDAGATVSISAASTLQDQGTTDTNAGTWNVKDGGELSLSGNSSFVESSGAKLGVTIDTSATGGGISGGTITVTGTLTVTTVGTPTSGTAYTVLSSPGGSFSGTFSTINTGSTSYTAAYAVTGLTLTAT